MTISVENLKIKRTTLRPKLEQEAAAFDHQFLGFSEKNAYGHYRLACGHRRESQFTHMRLGTVQCQECLLRLHIERGLKKGLDYIAIIPNSNGKHQYRFITCCHLVEVTPSQLDQCEKPECLPCLEALWRREASAIGLTYLGPPKSGKCSRKHYRLACGCTRDISIADVRNNIVRCQECYTKVFVKEAKAHGHDFIRRATPEEQNSASSCALYKLGCCGHKQIVSYHSMRFNKFVCHGCYESRAEKPHITYIKLLTNSQGACIVKIGHSWDSKERNKTLNLATGVQVKTIKTWKSKNKMLACAKETELKGIYREYKIPRKKAIGWMSNGTTECYSIDVLRQLLPNSG